MLSGFNWIVEDKIAGSSLPGTYSDLESDLAFLRDSGFTHIVSLTEEPCETVFSPLNVYVRHFPIPDMGIPDLNSFVVLLKEMNFWIREGGKVLVHCKAGMGRTGVLLSCYLITHGIGGQEAIDTIRRIMPGYIQNDIQERYVRRFELVWN